MKWLWYTDKKENKSFLIYKKNSEGSSCKVISEEGENAQLFSHIWGGL
jgi:hypothetical protein